VIDMSDGELIDRRKLPATPWLMTAGRNIAQLIESKGDDGPRKTLRIIDAVSGRQIYSADYGPAVCMTTLEPNAVAVVERSKSASGKRSATPNVSPPPAAAPSPNGRFQLIDVGTGTTLIDQQLPLAAVPTSLHTLKADNRLFVFVGSRPRQQSSRSIGLADYPLIDGQVFAFDLGDGRLMWPGPAVVEQRGIALTQPSDIPLLIFVDRLLKRDSGGGGTKLRLLCLDKQTGQTIYRNDELPDTPGSLFRIRAAREETPTVSIEMSNRTVRLSFTDQPRSPEPPANDLVEAPRKSSGGGLLGVGRQVGNMIQSVIQDPNRANWPRPAPDPARDTQPQPLLDDD
jgi:hypothetical protein